MTTTDFPPAVEDLIGVRSFGVCEVCGEARAVEHHHRRPRGQGGTRRASTSSPANGLHTCRACHRMIEANRVVARLCGWLVPQHSEPDTVPVLVRGRWVLLADDGIVTDYPEEPSGG